jgi:hypothetical protein
VVETASSTSSADSTTQLSKTLPALMSFQKLTIDCDPISYNDRSKLCHALIAEGYSFEENNEMNTVTVLGASEP